MTPAAMDKSDSLSRSFDTEFVQPKSAAEAAAIEAPTIATLFAALAIAESNLCGSLTSKPTDTRNSLITLDAIIPSPHDTYAH